MKRDGVFQRTDRPGWWVSFVDARGERKKQKVQASNKTQAAAALSAIKARVQRETILGVREVSDISTADLFARYLKYQKAHVSPATVERSTGILGALGPSLPAKLRDIDRKAVNALIAERVEAVIDKDRKRSAATVQKEISVLKHALRLAVEWELIQSNPADRAKLPKASEGRTRYLSPPELKAVLEAAPDWARGPLALAAFTGMRRGEILKLRWTDIDGARAYLRDTKNGSLRVVPLNALAMQVVESLPQTPGLVFKDVNAANLTVYTRRLFARLGIEGASFHSLRHTAASWLTMEGVDLYVVGQILGHKTPRMTQRYAHLSPKFAANAVSRLDSALAGVLGDGDAVGTKNIPKVVIQ